MYSFKNLRNKKIILLLFISFSLLFIVYGLWFVLPVFAQIKWTPQIEIPGFKETEIHEKTLVYYISNFYQWSVTAIAVLAVIMIMVSGLQWIFAAGNPPAIQKARAQLTSSLLGLVLILLCIPLLKMINPALVRLSTFKIPSIERIVLGTDTDFVLDTTFYGVSEDEFIIGEEGDLEIILIRSIPDDQKEAERVGKEWETIAGIDPRAEEKDENTVICGEKKFHKYAITVSVTKGKEEFTFQYGKKYNKPVEYRMGGEKIEVPIFGTVPTIPCYPKGYEEKEKKIKPPMICMIFGIPAFVDTKIEPFKNKGGYTIQTEMCLAGEVYKDSKKIKIVD